MVVMQDTQAAYIVSLEATEYIVDKQIQRVFINERHITALLPRRRPPPVDLIHLGLLYIALPPSSCLHHCSRAAKAEDIYGNGVFRISGDRARLPCYPVDPARNNIAASDSFHFAVIEPPLPAGILPALPVASKAPARCAYAR